MDYGFELPDEIWNMPKHERRARIRGMARVFVMDESRGFVRTMLPVNLDKGSVTFGIWLEVSASTAQQAQAVWDEPAYVDLKLQGRVANYLAPWGNELLHAAATAKPADSNTLPFIYEGDAIVKSLLEQRWSRETVTAALPNLRHDHG